jgi:hypothetical protein
VSRAAALSLLVALFVPVSSPAQVPRERGAELTVYLMTFGPGREVWERFGHNAIWIHDPVHGTDQAYNYGLFDFRQENFILRFVRGQMWYWMAGFPAESYIRQYERDNRSVWLQELDISPKARLELQHFLQWNELPEHKFYHYDYYRDNCSTRVRDALDRVLGGAIRRQTETVRTDVTYRFHTQRLTTNNPFIFTGLLLALGERVDRPITAWEEMFLPVAMREHLRTVRIAGPAGAVVPLVKSERTVFESTAAPPPDEPPDWLAGYFAIGAAIGASIVALAGRARESRRARATLLVLAGIWSLVAGLAGLILAGLWGLTDHLMAACNENLLQLNPLSLALLPLLPAAVRGDRRRRGALRVAAAVASLSFLGFAIQLLPWFNQVNGPAVALALPAHLGIVLGIRRLS